jgi:predicted acylesterase/phospholipase RssA
MQEHAHDDHSHQGHVCNDPYDEEMFSHIAVALSGGGIRATGFHLGMLDVLDRLELLQNVHILSSLSGGSMIGTTYALCAQEWEAGLPQCESPLQHCFNNLYDFLNHLNTMEEIFQELTVHGKRSPSGRRDLINGMANMLDERFFGNAKYYKPESRYFGTFWEDKKSSNHLKEIVFNAAEFKTGNAFRFQKSQLPCYVGNSKVWIDETAAQGIRMADVLSASACIPAGMEPLFFPDDFHWPDDHLEGRPTCARIKDHIAELRKDQDADPYVALVDGGVYDNQGLFGIILAMLRRNRARQGGDRKPIDEPVTAQQWYDWMKQIQDAMNATSDVVDEEEGIDLSHLRLFIISDTPLRNNSIYPKENTDITYKKPGFFGSRTLGQYDGFLWLLCILMLASAAENLYELLLVPPLTTGGSWLELARNLIGFAIPALVCLGLAGGLIWFRRTLKRVENKVEEALPPFTHRPWHYVKKIRVADAFNMIRLRVGSTAALASKFFMHRIRQLEYSTIFASERGSNSLSDRIMTNEIFTLIDPETQKAWLPEVDNNSEIVQVVQLAASMKTALWVDSGVSYRGHGELDILVSAGQATTCYNLMLHLKQRYGDPDTGALPEGSVAARYYNNVLDNLWKPLMADPFCLVKELKKGLDSTHVATCTRGCGLPSDLQNIPEAG